MIISQFIEIAVFSALIAYYLPHNPYHYSTLNHTYTLTTSSC